MNFIEAVMKCLSLLADGEAAFQEVFHAHLHDFPHFAGDRIGITADWADKS